MKYFRIFLCIYFFLFSPRYILFSENFRVHSAQVIFLDKKMPEKTTVQCGINDALYIKLPQNNPFLQGIDIDIKIPQTIANFRDAVAFSIYADISPTPQTTVIDYSGERLNINTFGGKLRQNIKIPLKKNHDIKGSPYSLLLPQTFTDFQGGLFLRFQLVMKGVSQDFFEALYTIEVKPIYTNEGFVDLEVVFPENTEQKSFSVFIDEKEVNATKFPFIMKTGLHHLNITSDYYRGEMRSFTIDQAKSTTVKINLQDIAPLLFVSAPENTLFFLDDRQIALTNEPLVLKSGTHAVRFLLGNYEIIKNLEVLNGKNYRLNVIFDLDIREE